MDGRARGPARPAYMTDIAQEHDPVEDTRMTLGEHLAELRVRLIRSAIAIGLVFAVCWGFRNPLTEWVFQPYRRAATQLTALVHANAAAAIEKDSEAWKEYYEVGYPEEQNLRPDRIVPSRPKGDSASQGIFFQMKMCFFFALFFGGPVLLWQMWQFVAAGLYRHEKGVVHKYFPASAGLFVGGVLFGYFVMVPYALYFLAKMTIEQIQYWETIGNYWTFLIALTLALGMIFQLPVVMLALAKLDLVQPKTFAHYRAHTIVGALVLAAIITPPDPFTQMMMAVPVIILYEAGHWIARATCRPAPGPPAQA